MRKPRGKPLSAPTIADFAPDPHNANQGTERGRSMLEHSLRTTGAGRSIVVDKHGEVIAGNKTLEAWGEISENVQVVHTTGQELVIVQRDDLDLADPAGMARQLAYLDNRTGEIGLAWDAEAIVADIKQGVDLSQLWSQKELETFYAELQQRDTDSTESPTQADVDRVAALQAQYQVAPGQLWQCGIHRILCGDCREESVRHRLLGETMPHMVVADPPYGVDGKGYNVHNRHNTVGDPKPFGSRATRETGAASIAIGQYAPIIGDDTIDTAVQTSHLLLTMYPDAQHIWWGANHYAASLPQSPCWLVWDKETTGDFADCELAWTNIPKAARLFRHRWNGLLRESEHERRWHPTQKPAALMMWVYTTLGTAGDIVFDPFMGCGPTVLAAERLNRQVYACELSPDYVAVTLYRWAQMTGKTPELLEKTA